MPPDKKIEESRQSSDSKSSDPGARISEKYGSIILDLSYAILRNSALTQQALKQILKEIRKAQPGDQFLKYERAWVLKITCEKLLKISDRHGFQIKPTAQFNFDTKLQPEDRIDHFDYYFHRLPVKSRLILLLRDKYNLPYGEIGSVLDVPRDSLRITRQHALRSLEEWIWEQEFQNYDHDSFDWHSKLSEYLDGDLPDSEKIQADRYLENSIVAREKYHHYQIILRSIAADQGRSLLLKSRAQESDSNVFELFQSRATKATRWSQLPWFVRNSLEGLGVAILILGAFALTPKIRGLYEKNLEQRLNDFNVADFPADVENNETIEDWEDCEDEECARLAEPEIASSRTTTLIDELPVQEEEEEPDEFDRGILRVTGGEIWRFNMKTDSPKEMQRQVTKVLADLGVLHEDQSELLGRISPGGVQFDMVVHKSVLPEIKRQTEQLATSALDSSVSNTFTWYKNRHRNRLKKDHVRVVIWLSQI